MIVSLSQEVCQQVQEIDRLERLKNNVNSFQATFDALIRVREVIKQLRALVVLLNERLGEHTVQNIVDGMEQLARDMQASSEKLESQPRQVKELEQIQKKAQEFINDLKTLWKRYAQEHTRETLELLRLVNYLPEVEAEQTIYQSLTSRLRHYMDNTPLIPAQLAEFDTCFQQLNQHLSNIKGLSKDVKRFLENVLKDQATLADMTDEVLQWCRQGEHAHAFVVGFAMSKRG